MLIVNPRVKAGLQCIKSVQKNADFTVWRTVYGGETERYSLPEQNAVQMFLILNGYGLLKVKHIILITDAFNSSLLLMLILINILAGLLT